MKPLSLAKHIRIIEWSIVVLVLALAGLVTSRLLAYGFSEISSFDASQILNISVQLFAIINPFSALPTFLAFTEGLSEVKQRKVARTTTLVVLALVFAFALFGQLILNALQVSVQSFELGGGVLLMIIAIDMLGGAIRTKAVDLSEAAIVPLATPLLVGPGTMATLIVLAGTQHVINVLIGGFIAVAIIYLFLRYSSKISEVIGKNGVQASSRLMAIILAAIAANMIHNALLAWGIAKF
jgi:multiple antibiotic resistance protein